MPRVVDRAPPTKQGEAMTRAKQRTTERVDRLRRGSTPFARARIVPFVVWMCSSAVVFADDAPDPATLSPEESLRLAREHYNDLDFDRVVPYADAVIANQSVSAELQLDAYVLKGSALAIIGDPVEAETPFRLLLRSRPGFEFPPETAPKIVSVFRKVQAEERAIGQQLVALQRERVMKSLELSGEHPSAVVGGTPVVFTYVLKDPLRGVEAVSVRYRKAGERAYSSLALKSDGNDGWSGAIPADWTTNDAGFVLEYYFESKDSVGPLLVVGSAAEPRSAQVSPGAPDRSSPPPLPLWSFVTAAFTAGAVTIVAGGLAAATIAAQLDYWSYRERGLSEPIDGPTLKQKGEAGTLLAWSMNGALATSLVLWVGVGVAAFFTNYTGEEASEAAY